ncbi:hypothetical protein PMAYCL1PPCAC_01007 [Pristionchus mayeri]|uniref:Uncharacterized protein n=1 Tax=Pristionchus mayeri TaxID=1317129 RepID=A0AAN5C5K0_9BILA|nr:hypothetical protein PMAYCL1PPCAC_01007 [Pristionchus mayeri]
MLLPIVEATLVELVGRAKLAAQSRLNTTNPALTITKEDFKRIFFERDQSGTEQKFDCNDDKSESNGCNWYGIARYFGFHYIEEESHQWEEGFPVLTMEDFMIALERDVTLSDQAKEAKKRRNGVMGRARGLLRR